MDGLLHIVRAVAIPRICSLFFKVNTHPLTYL
jgi:hypothetical protein